jgi:hypothetical protein
MNLFAAGFMVGKAAATTANPNPTPRKFGQLQEATFDDSFDNKDLMSTGSSPLRNFRGQRKTEIKAKFARINLSLFSDMYYGGTVNTGATLSVFNEVATVPTTPFQVTVANSATFTEDQGVDYAATGQPLKLVATSPTIGQYSVAAGVYTFATADAAAVVLITYSYTITTGQTVSVPTSLQSEAPYFEVILSNPTDGGYQRRCFRCSSNKLSLAFKQGEIVYPDFDMKVYDPGTGVLYVDNLATP